MRIARGSVVGVFAGEIVGVFTHVKGTDQYRVGRFQPGDERRIRRRRRQSTIDFGAGEGGKAGDVVKVLDGERHAGELTARRPARAGSIDGSRLGERSLAGDGG